MTIGPSGNVGIGVYSAVSLLEVNNGTSTQPFAQVTTTTFGTGAGSGFLAEGREEPPWPHRRRTER